MYDQRPHLRLAFGGQVGGVFGVAPTSAPRFSIARLGPILDPPYWGGENDYGKLMFERADFQRMADMLRETEGHFILSINDVPEVREIFSGFHFEKARLKYTASAGATTDARELIISDSAPVVDLFA